MTKARPQWKPTPQTPFRYRVPTKDHGPALELLRHDIANKHRNSVKRTYLRATHPAIGLSDYTYAADAQAQAWRDIAKVASDAIQTWGDTLPTLDDIANLQGL